MPRRLDTCPACRALLEPGTAVCPYCATQIRVRRRGAGGAVVAYVFRAPASAAIFAVILAAFGAEVAMEQAARGGAGGLAAFRAPSTLTLDRLGANAYALDVVAGEWWRLLTAVFLHIGLLHLAFNGIALLDLAPLCERAYGTARFLCVYLLAGIAGNLVSLLWHGQRFANAGASGALCGLLGLLLVFRLGKGWDIEAEIVRRTSLRWLAFTLLFGALAGADNAAHLGGAAAGLAVGLLLGVRSVRQGRAWSTVVWRPAAAALSALALASFAAMVLSQNAWRRAEEAIALSEDFDALQAALGAGPGEGREARVCLEVAVEAFARRPVSDAALAAARDDVARAARARLGDAAAGGDAGLLDAMDRFKSAWGAAAAPLAYRLVLIQMSRALARAAQATGEGP